MTDYPQGSDHPTFDRTGVAPAPRHSVRVWAVALAFGFPGVLVGIGLPFDFSMQRLVAFLCFVGVVPAMVRAQMLLQQSHARADTEGIGSAVAREQLRVVGWSGIAALLFITALVVGATA